jgi:hypothetical protein
MNDIAIIEQLTGGGVIIWAFLAVGAPAAIFFEVFRRLQAAKKAVAARDALLCEPGAPVEPILEPPGRWATSAGEIGFHAPPPVFWTDGDDPRRFGAPDPPDIAQRKEDA